MNPVFAQLIDLGQVGLWAGFVVFLRTGAAMALLPVFGDRAVPVRIRLGLALAFAAITVPAVLDRLPAPGSTVVLATEPIAGLALGFGLRAFVAALQMAGTMAAQSTSLSQIFGGAGPEPQPAIAQILMMAGLALALAARLHVRIAQLLILSYDLLPAGQFPKAPDLSRWGLAQIAGGFSLAFTLAAPFVVAALIYNVALGVINRAMPQLMVAFVGAPALTLGGLMLLALAAPIALSIWMHGFSAFLDAPFRVPP